MKGIVLETKGSYAAVLTDDGAVCKVRNHSYDIGEEIIVKKESYSHSMLLRVGTGVAAVFALFMLSAFAYFTPTGYVSLDVNPSIEYSINMFDRVLKVKAANGDAVELLGAVDFKNMPIQQALEQTTAKLIEKGYITDTDANNIYITTTGKNTKKSEELAERLEGKVRKYVDQEGKSADVEAEAIGLARVEEARELEETVEELVKDGKLKDPVKVTPGKLNLVQKMIDSESKDEDTKVTEETKVQYLSMSVKEIQERIWESKKGYQKPNDDNTDDEDEELTEKEKQKNDKAKEKQKKNEQKQKEKTENKNNGNNTGNNEKENNGTGKGNEQQDDSENDDTNDQENGNKQGNNGNSRNNK